MPRYSTQHYSTLQYTTLITPQLQLQLQLQLKTATTLQLQLHLQLQPELQLHYTTLHPAVVVRWPLQPLQPLQKTQLQPHPTTFRSISGFALPSVIHNNQPLLKGCFLFLKLPPSPCAVVLVWCSYIYFSVPVSITSCGTWAVCIKCDGTFAQTTPEILPRYLRHGHHTDSKFHSVYFWRKPRDQYVDYIWLCCFCWDVYQSAIGPSVECFNMF